MNYPSFVVLIVLIYKCQSKCVMYDACTNLSPLYKGQSPFEAKWQNCEYSGEPQTVHSQHVMQMFKKLCPSLYNGDDRQALCCSANQIRILAKSISEAEAIIGSCPSCYFNFRNFWCQITCHPDQQRFVQPIEFRLAETNNFSHVLHEYEKAKQITDYQDYEDYEQEEAGPRHMGYVVSKINVYMNREYLSRLIESCRDVKLYGSDVLQGFCGVPAHMCTPEQYAHHMGLEVDQNPFKMNFILNQTEQKTLTIYRTRIDEQEHRGDTVDALVQPVMPQYFMCNQSFQFGDLDYGSKCSCKACQASCEIHDEFLIESRPHFKVGKVDGAAFIMSFIFVFFLAFFVRYLYVKHIRPKTSGLGSNSSTSSSIDSAENPTFDQKKAKKCAALGCLCPRERKNSLLTETDEPSEPSRRSRYKKRLKSGLKKVNFLDKMLQFGDKLERWIELKFQNLGKFCATYPALVLTLGLTFCCLMCVGYFNFKIEKDPIRLWSADSSIARQNKKYFDHHFGPFYRITQLIIEPKSTLAPSMYHNLTITGLQVKILQETFRLYSKLLAIKQPVSLDEICFKPLEPENNHCAVQSVFEYFQNSEKKISDYLSDEAEAYRYLLMCMRNPLTVDCLSSYGGPIQPYLVIGSYDSTKTDYINAGSLIINFIINNYITEDKKTAKAMAWEEQALGILNNYTSDLINVYYTTERSIEDELERESKADIKIIAISYLAMFFYLTLTLGKYSSLNLKVIILEMKIFLALAGVSLVILSVFSSGGFFASIGVPSTLITLEVIPFLLLAVGVDNVYILVQTYQNDERRPGESIEEQISRIVGKVGPSMLLTGTTQSAAFLISALTPMPGVRAFSLYASLAIIINFLMQVTCFVVLLTLDAKREQSKRIDLLCCIKLNLSAMGDSLQKRKSFLYKFFNKVYTPILFNDVVRAVVIVVFVGFFFACLAMCDKIKVGLDQKLTMPQDSYQLKYFEALQKHLSVGPPVYFVLKDGYNYSSVDQVRKLCGSPACHTNSLQSLVSSASFFPNQTYIAQPPENWLDDYIEWLEARSPSYCCYEYVAERRFCDYVKLSVQDEHLCHKCPINKVKYDFPDQTSLLSYVKYFLSQNPSRDCIKAGHAMHASAVNLHQDTAGHVTSIGSSHFMAYHKVLTTSEDFINAMRSAYKISDAISQMLNNGTDTSPRYEVFPYSIFYVFYEQYLTIWQDATMQLILTLFAIFVCTFILLSFDLFTALIVTVLIAIIIIDMVGIMYLWNIELNAISLVNLVIAIGISVEFCSHIARAFATSDANSRKERASEALSKMGPPVFSGVLQSIVGISVLAFAHSQLFQVFYFRMYISILLLGLTHGLIFLPVLLTYIGRSSNHLAVYRARTNFEIKFSNRSEFNSSQVQLKKGDSESSDQTKSSFNHQVPSNSPNCAPNQIEYEDEFDEFQINNQFLRQPEKSNVKNSDRDSPVSRDCLLNNENESNNSEEIAEEQTLKIAVAQRAVSLSIPTRKKKIENDETFLTKSSSSKTKLNKNRAKSNSESLNI